MSTYDTGSLWEVKGYFCPHILAQVAGYKCVLIPLSTDCNRIAEPYLVAKIHEITFDEVQEMASSPVTFICDMPDVHIEEFWWRSSNIEALILNQRKVSAIKELRMKTKPPWSLRKAKDAIEIWGRELGAWT